MAVYRGKWCFIHWMSVMIVLFFRPNANNQEQSFTLHVLKQKNHHEWWLKIGVPERETFPTHADVSNAVPVMFTNEDWPWWLDHEDMAISIEDPITVRMSWSILRGKASSHWVYLARTGSSPPGLHSKGSWIQAGLYESTNVGFFKTPKSQMKLRWNIDGTSTKQTSMNRGRS